MLALLAAIPVAVLPATSREVPAAAVEQAEAALQKAMPVPFQPAKLELAAEHLAAAGPACRADPACVCTAVPLEAGARVLDLDVQRLSAHAWAADVRLVEPCENRIVDRKAAVIEANAGALSAFVTQAAGALLRGRDLGQLRYSRQPAAVRTAPAPQPSAPAQEQPAKAEPPNAIQLRLR